MDLQNLGISWYIHQNSAILDGKKIKKRSFIEMSTNNPQLVDPPSGDLPPCQPQSLPPRSSFRGQSLGFCSAFWQSSKRIKEIQPSVEKENHTSNHTEKVDFSMFMYVLPLWSFLTVATCRMFSDVGSLTFSGAHDSRIILTRRNSRGCFLRDTALKMVMINHQIWEVRLNFQTHGTKKSV